MGFYYSVMGSTEYAIQYCTKSLQLANITNNERIVGLATQRLGYSFFYKSEFSKAIHLVEKSIKILEKLKDFYWVSRGYQTLGVCYWTKGDWVKSIEHSETFLRISEELSDETLMSLAYWTIAVGNLDKGEWDIGIEYCKKCLDIAPPIFAAHGVSHLGYGYYKKGDLEKARDYLFCHLVPLKLLLPFPSNV